MTLNVVGASVDTVAGKKPLLSLKINGCPGSDELLALVDALFVDYAVEVIEPQSPVTIELHAIGELQIVLHTANQAEMLETAANAIGPIKSMIDWWPSQNLVSEPMRIHEQFYRDERRMYEAWLAGQDLRRSRLESAKKQWHNWMTSQQND